MKKTQLVYLLIVMMISVSSFAQKSAGTITGMLMNDDGKAIPGATVSLKKALDSSLVKMSIVDEIGQYSFEQVAFAKYFVEVSSVGYQPYSSAVFEISAAQATHQVPEILLSPQVQTAEGVTVVAKKPAIESKPGMMVVNVDAAPSNMGLNALELLEKSPGVSLDNEGNISLKGKQGVTILIDGKPTYMSGADLATVLKGMDASQILSIEIMTNPPAKYDASGNSGVINIKTKKSLAVGANGSIGAGYVQSYYPRGYANANFNYRNEKMNVFGSYNYNHWEGFNELNITRTFYKADKVTPDSYSDQKSRNQWSGNSHNIKAGIDYNLSKKSLLGVMLNGTTQSGSEHSRSNLNLVGLNNTKTHNFLTKGGSSDPFQSISANINYKLKLDDKGHEFSADADFANYTKKDNKSYLETTIQDLVNGGSSTVYLKGDLPSTINIYSAKVDYVKPLKNDWKLEAGLKSSFVKSDNKVDYLRSINNVHWDVDGRSNHFLFDENINAGYANLTGVVKKWQIALGLRVENTNSKGNQVVLDSTFTRHYTDLFPNVGFGYTMNDNNNFNVSYSRRVNRPNYNDLNPFIFFLDSLTYGKGNPYLMPEFTNNFELTHSFKNMLFTTLNYSVTNDVIAEMLQQSTADKITYQTRDNVAKRTQIGLSVMANIPVQKWWNLNVYTNVYNNQYKGIYNNDPLDVQFTTFMGNITNNFSFGKGWNAELSGWYRSKGTEGLLVINELYAINGGISKQIMNKKGSIRFSVRDMFWTQKVSGYVKYSDINVNLSNMQDSRRFTIGFTYKFGKTTIKQARDRKTGLEEEQGRVGGGNG